MQRQVYNAHTNNKPAVQPIALGGTGSTSEVDACIALNILRYSEIGTEAVPLDNNSKVPVQYIPGLTVVSGDTIDMIPQGDGFTIYNHKEYKIGRITNYDCKREYIVSATEGTLYIYTQANFDAGIIPGLGTLSSEALSVGDLIYVASSFSGDVTVQVNTRTFTFPVMASSINNPHFISPINNASFTTLPQNFELSSAEITGYFDSTYFPEVQFATDINFTNVITTRQGTIGDVFVNIDNLINGNYYIRCRYRGTTLQSGWSTPIQISLLVSLYPTNEIQILHRPDIDTLPVGGQFGKNAALSPDGTLLAISDPEVNVTPQISNPLQRFGKIYIYKKVVDLWVLQGSIDSGKADSQFRDFGSSILFSPDNQVIIVGSAGGRYNTFPAVYSGLIQVFRTLDTDDFSSYQVGQSIDNTPNDASYQSFGRLIKANAAFTRIAVSAGNTALYTQKIIIYDLVENSFTKSAEIVNPNQTSYSGFGAADNGLALSSDGTRLLVSDPSHDSGLGVIYVYDFDGTNWNLTNTIVSPGNPNFADFGFVITFGDNDKNKIACSYSGFSYPSQAKVFIYDFDGTNWNQTHEIAPTDWTENTLGGKPSWITFLPGNTKLLVGSKNQTARIEDYPTYGAGHGDGAVYLYELTGSGTNWTELKKYTASDLNPANSGSQYGNLVLLNAAATEMVVCSLYKKWSGVNQQNGAVYIYK